jgi:hypothetical protein
MVCKFFSAFYQIDVLCQNARIYAHLEDMHYASVGVFSGGKVYRLWQRPVVPACQYDNLPILLGPESDCKEEGLNVTSGAMWSQRQRSL